ncbi:MAG: hypothetical protein L0Y72_08935 [Gemmataceae bacterium]|nr:hypothetical protein [Gemmataceae bacterium]MCI0739155.1 hypothetical protein [Gemmataceae bacterium]
MRSRWICALALGVGVATLAQAEDGTAKSAGNWFTPMLPWNLGKNAPEPKSPPPATVEAPAPAKVHPQATRLRAEQEWLRRQEACDKLREVALQTNDTDLLTKAEVLEKRAWEVYRAQSGVATSLTADEQLLESKLGSQSAVEKLTGRTSAARQLQMQRAAAMEDQP